MSTQQSLLDLIHRDICARRHKNNPLSVEAHSRVIHSKEATYKKILEYVQRQGEHGATVHEVAEALGYGNAINRASPRLSELKAMLKLKESGEKRGNAAVLVLVGS